MSPQPAIGPISADERIEFIDVLRGMALFGILAANMRAFNAPIQIYDHIQRLFPSRPDVWAQALIDTFISGKFVTLFSFLFGIGFAVMLTRAEARGASFTSFFPRRLLALMAFGLIHGIVIWAGDILLAYSVGGFVLFFFRKSGQRTVLAWSASILGVPLVGSIVFFIASLVRPRVASPPKPPNLERIHQIIETYAHGSPLAILKQNWKSWVESIPFAAFALFMLCVFLAGLYIWRSGLLHDLAAHESLLQRTCAWTLPLGLAANAFAVFVDNITPTGGKMTLLGLAAILARIAGMPTLSCGYACGLALLYLKPGWRARLRPFAAVGRMALTNYLSQSVVCVLFYYSFTTGLYGKVGPAWGLVPTVVLYAIQVLWSNWWLARFRFGPMEWLWRGLTYGRLPSLRPVPAPPVAGVAGAG